MKRSATMLLFSALVVGATLAQTPPSPQPVQQPPSNSRVIPSVPSIRSRPLPRPEAVAETRLLMEGLAQPNFKGLQRLLDKQPPNADGWAFARGQALLIAETANLLMLRPPQSEGRDVWMERAADVRATATRLARSTASRDYAQARLTFNTLAAMCNRCHQTFRVPTRVEGLASPVENRGKAPVP